MRRKSKIIVSIALFVTISSVGWWFWSAHEEWLDGFDAAGLSPIPGAKLIADDYGQQTARGGSVYWVYQIPTTYTDELYKDCSHIGFETGVAMDNGKPVGDVEAFYKPGVAGCYLQKDKKGESVFSQFIGDKLVVEDIF